MNLFFIPVRKGSKGIPGKNLKYLRDKPLISWILDVILKLNTPDEIWVATDCDKMETYINDTYSDRVKIYRRSDKNAQDSSPTIDVVTEFIQARQLSNKDYLILLQTTSPFTSVADISMLVREIEMGEYDSYIACSLLKKFRWSKDGHSLDYSLYEKKPRRQDYEGFLIETGNFYASSIRSIINTGHLISGKVKPIILQSSYIIDIDEEDDWLIAQAYANLYG